jgi:hypothetical protein
LAQRQRRQLFQEVLELACLHANLRWVKSGLDLSRSRRFNT